MSALRYSGALRIRITIVERGLNGINEEYRCCISCPSVPGHERCTVFVGAKVKRLWLDHPEMFDGAARAALSLAAYEGWPVNEHAARDIEGDGAKYIISRSVKNSHVWL